MKMIKIDRQFDETLTRLKLPYRERLCIASQDGHLFIWKKDIAYLQANSNYCIIQSESSKIVCSQTLKKVNSRLRSPIFMKVHQSYVVNLHKIKSINHAYTLLTLEDGSEIPIARARKQKLKQSIELLCD